MALTPYDNWADTVCLLCNIIGLIIGGILLFISFMCNLFIDNSLFRGNADSGLAWWFYINAAVVVLSAFVVIIASRYTAYPKYTALYNEVWDLKEQIEKMQ